MTARSLIRAVKSNAKVTDRASAQLSHLSELTSVDLRYYNVSINFKGGAKYRSAKDDTEYNSYPDAVRFTSANGVKFIIDADEINLHQMGARGGSFNDTEAFAVARTLFRMGKTIIIPGETFQTDTALFDAVERNRGQVKGLPRAVIKGTAAATKLFRVEGISGVGNNTYNVFQDFTLDMSAMTSAATSIGLYGLRTWGNSFRNVDVVGHTSAMRTAFFDVACYTTVFDNCDLGSTTGVVEFKGTSLSVGVTTVLMTGCSFAKLIAENVVSINVIGGAIQGNLDKFVLSNIAGFTISGVDVEGAGTYLVLGSGVVHLASFNNEFSGFSGTYMSGTFGSGTLMDCFGSRPFVFQPVSEEIQVLGRVTETKTAAGLFRKLIQSLHTAAAQVDIQIKNFLGSVYIGIDASGKVYMDGRGTGRTVIQVVGTDKLGVDSDRIFVGTTLASTVGASGPAAAPPASPRSYINVVFTDGTTGKIPVYNT